MNPDEYPHRELMLSDDPDAGTTLVLLDMNADLDALKIDMLRDCIADRVHVLLAAQDSASLALAAATFRILVKQSKPHR